MKNSFKQIISFTQAVSIRIQVLFGKKEESVTFKGTRFYWGLLASIYLDYLYGNDFHFHGLTVQRDSLIKLSSITVDNRL